MRFNSVVWRLGALSAGGLFALLLATGLAVGGMPPFFAQPTAAPLRGVWIQSRSIATPEAIQETIQRVEAGRFNAVFLEVIVGSGVFYQSSSIKKHETVAADFDPLAHFIQEAHQRHIKVHAWFPVGYTLLNNQTHPSDWAVVNTDGSQPLRWPNFVQPEVRHWLTEVILEVVQNYDIDGVHLDTIRYPGPNVSFDSYSTHKMATNYGVNLELLRGSTLPAFGYFRGNPLVKIGTAQVLAEFENGVPAILLNQYGQGQVIVLNWIVGDRPVAASSQILARSIRYLQQNNHSTVFLLDDLSATYHRSDIRTILNEGEIRAVEIKAEAIVDLATPAVLILPNVYTIPEQIITELKAFVASGGGLIFIDGPTRSIQNPDLQLLTGTRGSGDYFDQTMQLLPTGQHPIIPVRSEEGQINHEALLIAWNKFRTQGVNAFVAETFQQVKADNPTIIVSAAVKSRQKDAARTFQDWPAWLKNEFIDFVVPMAYLQEPLHLQRDLLDWRLATANDTAQIVPGLSVDFTNGYPRQPKPVDQVLNEIRLIQTNGYRGYVLFDLEHMTPELLAALAANDLTPAN